MKGLELAELYYNEFGKKMIEERFHEYKDRIAVGLVGEGSECYGFDDQVSRDHDWGPSFCLWLDHDDYQKIGSRLQEEYNRLPGRFHGFQRKISQWGDGRVGVLEIGTFYRKYMGVPQVPNSLKEWLIIPQDYLSTCTNGKVFCDPLGKFSQIRNKLLDFYPEDVRLVKIAALCMSAAQSGQYNLMRSIAHKEYSAALFAEAQFCSDIMALVFLLNRVYALFYKWRHRALRRLPMLGELLHEKISQLISIHDYTRKSDIIEDICSQVIKEFRIEGLSDSESDFLLDHGPVIHNKIKDEDLRRRNVWVG